MSPETIGPYRILEPLREGGVSSVYKAVGPAGAPVALKVFSTRVLASPPATDPPRTGDRTGDLVARFHQYGALFKGERRKMRKQAVEITARQGGEKLVVQRETGVWNVYCHCDFPPDRSGRFTAGDGGGRFREAARGNPCL